MIVSLFVYLKKTIAKTLYSYQNAGIIGGILFSSFLFLMTLRVAVYAWRDNRHGEGVLREVLYLFVSSAEKFLVVLVPFMFLVFFAAALSNLQLMRHEGKSPRNMLGFVMGTLIFAFTLALLFGWNAFASSVLSRLYFDGMSWITVFTVAVPLFMDGLLSYLECVMIGNMLLQLASVRRKVKYDADYIIILGCSIDSDGKPYPLLRGRIDRAIQFAEQQQNENGKLAYFVPSGGKGSDECISESESMRNYLVEQGIDPSRILMEDKSTTTLENMQFSKKLIEAHHTADEAPKIVFSTSNYHVFRSGIFAEQAGLHAVGIGSKTKGYFWPNAAIREFVALLSVRKRAHLMVALCLLIVSVLIGLVNYIVVLPK